MRNHAVRPRPRPRNSLPNPRGAYLGEDSATSPGHEKRREELGGIPPHRRRQHTTTTKGPTTQKTRLQNRQTEISLRNQRPRTGHPQTNFEMKVPSPRQGHALPVPGSCSRVLKDHLDASLVGSIPVSRANKYTKAGLYCRGADRGRQRYSGAMLGNHYDRRPWTKARDAA